MPRTGVGARKPRLGRFDSGVPGALRVAARAAGCRGAVARPPNRPAQYEQLLQDPGALASDECGAEQPSAQEQPAPGHADGLGVSVPQPDREVGADTLAVGGATLPAAARARPLVV